MSGSITHGGGENVPGIPGHAQPAILRIWQEAHVVVVNRDRWWGEVECCRCALIPASESTYRMLCLLVRAETMLTIRSNRYNGSNFWCHHQTQSQHTFLHVLLQGSNENHSQVGFVHKYHEYTYSRLHRSHDFPNPAQCILINLKWFYNTLSNGWCGYRCGDL